MTNLRIIFIYTILILDTPIHTQLFRRWPFIRLRQRISNNVLQTGMMTANEVSFHLYSDSRNKGFHERLMIGDVEGLKLSSFNPKLPVILCIHGFKHNYQTHFSQTMKNAYLENNFPANIIAVDWGPLATPPGPPNLNYHVVVEKVPVVGNAVAQFIRFLIQTPMYGISGPEQVHIVGFSLGAQIAGIAGYVLLQNGLRPIARITGLDPAGPLFQGKDKTEKLDSADASFVDVVHTNQGMKGYSGNMGHVDFYPNGGGPYQPGCRNMTDVSDIFTGSCSHARAYQFFAQSISNRNIMACKCIQENSSRARTLLDPNCKMRCDNPTIFGQYCPKNARGVYHVDMMLPQQTPSSKWQSEENRYLSHAWSVLSDPKSILTNLMIPQPRLLRRGNDEFQNFRREFNSRAEDVRNLFQPTLRRIGIT